MIESDGGPSFDAKLRFARDVETCLLEPGLPPAPHLLLRVRERVLRAELRRARRSEVRRLALFGVALIVAGVLGVLRLGAPFEEWLRRMGDLPAISALLRIGELGLTRPIQVLMGLGGVASITVTALLGLIGLYLVREIFTDPLRGLSSRRPGGR